MSPIKNLTEVRRLPRLGKIHLGIKVESPGKNPYPKAVDYFVCPPEVQTLFGDKPKALTIMFPIEDEAKFAQQWYRCYSMSRGLICRGNGEVADRSLDAITGALANRDTKEAVRREVLCPGPDCPEFQKKQCRPVLNLQFLLPSVAGLGIWQLDTSSFYSIVNINSGVDLIRSLCGRIAMIPLTLSLGPQKVTPEGGTKKTVYVLHLTSSATLADIQKAALIPPTQALLPAPEPPGEEEPPETLFPDTLLEKVEEKSEPPAPETLTEPGWAMFPEPTWIQWQNFWKSLNALGVSSEQARAILGKSPKEYEREGHPLPQIETQIKASLGKRLC